MGNKYLAAICAIILSVTALYAEGKWSRDDWRGFRQNKECAVIFDQTGDVYNGLDSIQFLRYAANINKTTPEIIGTTLQFLGYEIVRNLNSNSKQIHYAVNSDSPAVVKIKLLYITEKAGIEAEVSIVYDGKDYSKPKIIKVKDGRWNTFEQLVKENSNKLSQSILSYIGYVVEEYDE